MEKTESPQPDDGPAVHFPGSPIPRSITITIAVIVIAMTLWLSGRLAFSLMFSGFQNYDDEGAVLIVLDQMSHGHTLYDQVASMYGPVGFLPKYALIRLLGLPISHDTGRSLTLIYWMLTCIALGLAAWRICGSVAWFGVGGLASCLVLSLIVHEPGHPQDMCCLLLSLAVLLCTFSNGRKITNIVVGLSFLGGLLAMTKINLAAFYFGATGAALVYCLPPGRLRFRMRGVVVAILAVSPFVLMYPNLDKQWALLYATEISLALLACAGVAPTMFNPGRTGPRDLVVCVVSFVLTVVAVIAVTMSMGTSVKGLATGVLFLPLLISKSFVFTQGTYVSAVAASAIGLALAVMASIWIRRVNPPATTMTFVTGLLRITAGLAMFHYIWDGSRWPILCFGPGFAWILLLPVRRAAGGDQSFARIFLPFLAILEAMWAYPVCGTQLAYAVFLLALVSVITLADGIGDLASLIRQPSMSAAMPQLGAFTTFCGSFLVTIPVTSRATSAYEQLAPLDLPGSQWIHLLPANAIGWRVLTDNLRENADMFYTMPGLNSFYLWTALPPPTPTNLTQWMYLLSEKQQREVIDALAAHPRACVLYNPGLYEFWMQGAHPQGPLIQYLDDNFRPAFSLGDWIFKVRKDRKNVVKILPDGKRQELELSTPAQ